MNIGKHLFREGCLSDLLNGLEAQAREKVASLSSQELEGRGVAEIAETLLARLLPRPPVLRLDAQYARPPREIEVEVQDYGSTLRRPGTQVTVVTPFEGEAGLFRYEPSSSSSVAPQGIVEETFLYLKYQFAQGAGFDVRGAVDRDLALVQKYLTWIRTDVESFAGQLRTVIRSELARRREHVSEISRALQDLGIPIRTDIEIATSRARDTVEEPQYHAFISYAVEDRDFVEPLAHALSSAGIRVWFDQFELAVGDSLRESIDRGLRGSRYGIVVLSRSFFAKRVSQKS